MQRGGGILGHKAVGSSRVIGFLKWRGCSHLFQWGLWNSGLGILNVAVDWGFWTPLACLTFIDIRELSHIRELTAPSKTQREWLKRQMRFLKLQKTWLSNEGCHTALNVYHFLTEMHYLKWNLIFQDSCYHFPLLSQGQITREGEM